MPRLGLYNLHILCSIVFYIETSIEVKGELQRDKDEFIDLPISMGQ